jgi:hypothetical protein
MNILEKKINEASDACLDGVWIILRSDVGILRKAKIISFLLGISIETLKSLLPKNEQNFILDRESRDFIHKILLPESKKRKVS